MSKHIKSEPPADHLMEAAETIVRRAEITAREAADRTPFSFREVADTTRDAADRASETAKDMYHSAAVKAEETVTTSKEYVRRNPVPVVLGAIAFGAAVGYALFTASRKRSFGERYADEPLETVREAIFGVLAPVTQGVHRGYDSARDGAGKTIGRLRRSGAGRGRASFTDQIGRMGSNLKFW